MRDVVKVQHGFVRLECPKCGTGYTTEASMIAKPDVTCRICQHEFTLSGLKAGPRVGRTAGPAPRKGKGRQRSSFQDRLARKGA